MRSAEILPFGVPMKRLVNWSQYGLAFVAPLLLFAVGCCGATTRLRESASSRDEACRLISRTKERYRSCRSYEDKGTVTVVFSKNGSPGNTMRGVFDTGFDRKSGAFNFVYKFDHEFDHTSGRLWRQPFTTRPSWLLLNAEPREETELADGIERMVGVSNGTSRIVPSMLLGLQEPLWGSSLHLRGTDMLAGGPAFRLEADGSEFVSVWISAGDYSLRKVVTRETLQASPEDIQKAVALLPPGFSAQRRAALIKSISAPFVCETTIDYAPDFDRPIDPLRFESAASSTSSE